MGILEINYYLKLSQRIVSNVIDIKYLRGVADYKSATKYIRTLIVRINKIATVFPTFSVKNCHLFSFSFSFELKHMPKGTKQRNNQLPISNSF